MPTLGCSPDNACADGTIHIDHSLFNTRTPMVGAPGRQVIFEGPGNRTGDPLFADPLRNDYHLLAGSPAIDAGVADASAAPSDLDGRARVQGAAPDLGAFETTPAGGGRAGAPGGPGGGRSGPNGRAAAVLSGLRFTPSRFHVDGRAKIHFTLNSAASVKLTFKRLVSGHRRGGHCVAGKGRGKHCTALRSAGRLDVPNAQGRIQHGPVPWPRGRQAAAGRALQGYGDDGRWEAADVRADGAEVIDQQDRSGPPAKLPRRTRHQPRAHASTESRATSAS